MKRDPRTVFGQRLRVTRKERGWTQEQLALEADVDRTYVSGVESGRRNISLVNICKLAEALGVHPGVLFGHPTDEDHPPVGNY